MSLKEYAAKEFIRSPIVVTATVLGVLASIGGFFYSTLQSATIQAIASPAATGAAAHGLHLPNLVFVMSFFLASSLSAASLIRLLYRLFPFHAMVLSVPVAVLTGFLSLLVLQLAPARPFTEHTLEQGKDVVFWATLFVYVAINGRAAIDWVIDADPAKRSDEAGAKTSGDARDSGPLFVLVVQLLVWCGLVSAGISKLVQLFLR